MQKISFDRHRFPSELIIHAVWLYARFTLSFRDVEDILAKRGLDVSYETVRRWFLKFGGQISKNLRSNRLAPSDHWYVPRQRSIDGLEKESELSPGIFQAYVEKKYEVRLVVMGKSQFAFKIDSQTDESSKFDWRQRPEYTTGIIEKMDIPRHIQLTLYDFMKNANIVFGSFDFIVTPNNDWVFLEINPQGQFLWLEEDLPDVPLLDAFCDFLISRKPDFEYNWKEPKVRLSDYISRYEKSDYEEPQNVPEYKHPYVNTE